LYKEKVKGFFEISRKNFSLNRTRYRPAFFGFLLCQWCVKGAVNLAIIGTAYNLLIRVSRVRAPDRPPRKTLEISTFQGFFFVRENLETDLFRPVLASKVCQKCVNIFVMDANKFSENKKAGEKSARLHDGRPAARPAPGL